MPASPTQTQAEINASKEFKSCVAPRRKRHSASHRRLRRQNPEGKITTLGRGGSDTTAFLLAEALNADEVVLVTDADGIMSGDPKIITNPKRLTEIDVNTLVGLADSGAKFIHSKALKYKPQSVDVRVINSAHRRPNQRRHSHHRRTSHRTRR